MCQRRDLTGRVRDPDEVYQSRDRRQRDELFQAAGSHMVGTGKKKTFCGYGIFRVAPATRAQTDRRRISAVRASQTPGFEYVVRDGAFSARADFQPVPRGLTHRPVTTQARCARSVVAPENEKREM